MEIKFEFEKDTKNCIRFKEVLDGPLDVPVIGTLYVQKNALKTLEYKDGYKLVATLSLSK